MPDKKEKEEVQEMIDKLRPIICEVLGVDESEVTASANFMDDLGADSLDRVELVMAIEEELDIQIADDEADDLKTVKQVAEYVLKHSKPTQKRA